MTVLLFSLILFLVVAEFKGRWDQPFWRPPRERTPRCVRWSSKGMTRAVPMFKAFPYPQSISHMWMLNVPTASYGSCRPKETPTICDLAPWWSQIRTWPANASKRQALWVIPDPRIPVHWLSLYIGRLEMEKPSTCGDPRYHLYCEDNPVALAMVAPPPHVFLAQVTRSWVRKRKADRSGDIGGGLLRGGRSWHWSPW